MRWWQRSLGARLAWSAALLIAIALLFAGTGISFILHRFVEQQVDQRLDGQIALVASAISIDAGGTLVVRNADAPPFDRLRRGWYWEVRDQGDHVLASSGSLAGAAIMVLPGEPRWHGFWNIKPKPSDGVGPRGERLHLRIGQATSSDKVLTIIASAPVEAIYRPMWEAMRPLFVSLVLLGGCLAAASLLQVRFGLKPLRRLRDSVSAVRAGVAAQVPTEQPKELLPLTTELNTLLDQNVAGLERARRNVANLAHALKTPLATLAVTLQQSDRPQDIAMAREVERMERQIRHHLGRARAAALNGPTRTRTEIRPRVDEFAAMFAKVYADRGIVFTCSIDLHAAVACEPQDLDEMLGNVLDNAFKWAGSAVSVEMRDDGSLFDIIVGDDGPGLAGDGVLDALKAGQKLDETVAGDGFGLTITRELAELYNGGIVLGRASLGGLQVTLSLPKAVAV